MKNLRPRVGRIGAATKWTRPVSSLWFAPQFMSADFAVRNSQGRVLGLLGKVSLSLKSCMKRRVRTSSSFLLFSGLQIQPMFQLFSAARLYAIFGDMAAMTLFIVGSLISQPSGCLSLGTC